MLLTRAIMANVPDALTKMLLESSFKESAKFWTRNTGYLTFHGIMLGFAANIIKTEGYRYRNSSWALRYRLRGGSTPSPHDARVGAL